MNLQDILPKMSKLYLSRTLDSFLKDVKITSEEEMREVILKNIVEFQNEERVKLNLDFRDTKRNIGVLNELILIHLMENEGYMDSYASILKGIEEIENQIITESNEEEYFDSAIPKAIREIYEPVLVAAWLKDETLNAHEKNILEVLRKQLKLTKHQHRLIETRIGRFPQKGNKVHSVQQIDQSLRDLQSRGIILRIKTDDAYFVIPNEIARIVRYSLGGELRTNVFRKLLEDLHNGQLRTILQGSNLYTSGVKETLINRIIKYNILPSNALNLFSSKELTDILRKLEGANISGVKEEKVQNIIDYYENVSTTNTSDSTDERAIYYDYFEALSKRDYKTLRVNKIIKKDLEVENAFEKATNYLFEKKIEIEPLELKSTKRCDGKLKLNTKEVILWDNKSTEKPYDFPEVHFEQFLGYIRSEPMRPTLFMIITQEYTKDAIVQAQRLKAFSDEDTDVALITANDLKFIAEEWKEYSTQKNPKFNLQIFNLTGGLDRNTLMKRMEWAL